MELASIIGRNIASRRRQLDLRQRDVAACAGITQGYLSDLERGLEANVGLNTLNRIAGVLDITVPTLLMDPQEEPAKTAA